MMPEIENPALKQFVAQIGDELVLAQVLIRRQGAGYELRHAQDATVMAEALRTIPWQETRALAQFTAAGEFRPLKSAPTLQRGWQLRVANAIDLGSVLDRLYPGAVADWFVAQSAHPPVTNYRDYTGRQSGMYRITTLLDDTQATNVIATVCAPANCLKRRLWTVEGLAPDAFPGKSPIPCLEPCAILMESARQAVRAEQKENPTVKLAAVAKPG